MDREENSRQSHVLGVIMNAQNKYLRVSKVVISSWNFMQPVCLVHHQQERKLSKMRPCELYELCVHVHRVNDFAVRIQYECSKEEVQPVDNGWVSLSHKEGNESVKMSNIPYLSSSVNSTNSNIVIGITANRRETPGTINKATVCAIKAG